MGDQRDAFQRVLDDTRERFVATFTDRCDSIRLSIDAVATLGPTGALPGLRQAAHRLSGLAGTIGFAAISVHAAELETLVVDGDSGPFAASRAHEILDAIRSALGDGLAKPFAPPVPPTARPSGAKILVAEDEADQRAMVTAWLKSAGYVPIAVGSGDLVIETARAEKPALILLDIAMPRLDGYSACRLLKADPELAGTPVIFMTTGANLDDKLAGLMLGADEFLSKPVDMRELGMRMELLLERRHTLDSNPDDPCPPRELTYEAFVATTAEELQRSAVALAIVRVPSEHRTEGERSLIEELRGRDAIGAYGLTHLLITMPELTAVAARDRLDPVVDRLVAHGLSGICVGLTASAAPGTTTVAALIGEADEALAEARYLGVTSAIWIERRGRPAAVPAARTVVVAEDDPDVTRIVDGQMRAAGYKAIIAFDGEQAVAAVRAHAPDVLVLDLMMPKLDGFGVLMQLRDLPAPRPHIVVLSARGREQDVVRAFELGADDYMTKPFNPQELMVRVARLMRDDRLRK